MPTYGRAPAADFTNISGVQTLTNFANVTFSLDGTFPGQINGTDYRGFVVGEGGPIITPQAALTVPLSITMTAGDTATLPDGVVAGDKVYLVGVGDGTSWPATALGFSNITIQTPGPTGNPQTVSFRYNQKTWVDGDTIGPMANAAFVVAMRVPADFSHFINPATYAVSGYANAGVAAVVGDLAATLPAGSFEVIITAARDASQALIDLAPLGWTRIADIGGSNQRVAWRKNTVTTEVGQGAGFTLPTAFNPGGGGNLHLGFNP